MERLRVTKMLSHWFLRVVTSPKVTAREAGPSMAARLKMRILTSGTQARASCPWPIVGGTPTTRSSSSRWKKQNIWTSSMWLLVGCATAWTWCTRWGSWARKEGSPQRSLSLQIAGSFRRLNVILWFHNLASIDNKRTLDNDVFSNLPA